MKKYFNALGEYKFIYVGLLKIIDSILSVFSLSMIYPLTLFVLQNEVFFEKISIYFPFVSVYEKNTQILFVFFSFLFFTVFRYFFGIFSINETSNFVINRRFGWVKQIVKYYYGLDYLKLKKEKTGKLVSDWFNDTFNASQFLNILLASINNISFLLIFLALVLFNDPQFGIGIFIFTFVFLLLYFKFKNKSQTNNSILKLKYIQEIMILMTDIISYIRDIKIFTLENNASNDLSYKTKNLSKILIKNLKSSKKPVLFQELIILILVTLFFLFFYFNNFENINFDFSYLILLFTLGFKSLGYLSQLLKSYYKASIDFKSFNSAAIKLELINSIDQTKKDYTNLNTNIFSELNIRNTYYSYDKNNIFDNLNITIPLNKHILITGDSGSGKSTLLDILVCLIKPSKGFIEFVDNNGITFKNNKYFYSYVSQEVGLFGDSIDSCIVGNVDFNQSKINKIISLCKLTEVYKSQKIDFNLAALSGGQKTRIGLARALYYERPVLILDESLSSLEKELELNILNQIRKNYKNITILQVVHERTSETLADYRMLVANGKATLYKT